MGVAVREFLAKVEEITAEEYEIITGESYGE